MPLLNQEEPKTIFELEGKKYNVREEYLEDFIEKHPDATTVMDREDKKYRVKASDYKTFNLSDAPEERATINDRLGQMGRSVQQATTEANEHIDNMREYGFGFGQTKESKPQFNPESGKIEKTYLTPQGNRHTDKNTADMESFRYRRSVSNTTVSGQLQTAYKRLEELRQQEQTRASEVHEDLAEEYRKNTAPLASLLFAKTYVPAQQADKTKRSLAVAIRETEETIKTLEEQRDRETGKDIGFWRGFGRVVGDIRTWDLGLGDIQDAVTMLDATDPQGNLTDGEVEAQGAMLEAKQIQEQTEQQYGGNASFWNRAGMMAGHMPSFMLDFAITGGGFSGLSAMSKVGAKAATKVVGKEVVEEIVKQGLKSYVKSNGAKGAVQGATNWTIKALGTTADDLLIRAPLMTNTIQGAKTASDVIDRKLGDVVEGEDGSLKFADTATWGDAIWQGEANSIVENYSEMFGAHLDPVLSLGNVSKLANVIGAKRLSGVLAKADAGTLGGIMGTTNEMFNKMGVSDYVGEVAEEYYGQLWRTMLNLDDAYQQNPDGSRTNLLASGQFHGDIWGGMALTMGLMGAGKAGVSAAGYYSMKHDVSNADATANEMLGADVWEPLRSTIDLITNDDIGEVADIIVSDPKFTQEEKVAVLDYMEHSLNLRGFNLATMAQSRSEEMSDQDREINESYTNGYNIATPQEMVDANNMLNLQSQRVKEILGEELIEHLNNNPINELAAIYNSDQYNEEEKVAALDYINAKHLYDGMIQRVRDDIDSRISQSDAMIVSRTNRSTGAIHSATLKTDDRSVHIVSGNVVPFSDGTGVDVGRSDKSLIVRDAETGELEQISPDAILKVDEPIDPTEQSELAAQTIREQYAQAAADKIDGAADFNVGASYVIVGENGEQVSIQITPNEQGVIDNGDGTINVTDGAQIFALPKEVIQESANVANMARVVEFEQQRSTDNAPQTNTTLPYELGDEFVINHNGSSIKARIAEPLNADGMILVETDTPINGSMVAQFAPDVLSDMVVEYGGQTIEQTTSEPPTTPVEQPTINEEQSTNEEVSAVTAFEQIPKSESGEPLYEQADSDIAWDAIVEQTDGDEQIAQSVVEATIADKESELKKIEKAKPKGAVSIAEKIAAEKERKAIIDNVQQQIDQWKKIASTSTRRQQEAESIRRKQTEEAAAARKIEEDRLREEREEAERIEREALNGVPDMLNDTPQDARARSYRRVNGHKVDRQIPIQYLQGNEVAVKFSNDAIPTGSVAIIDASQLQPSHIQGVRNPLHFIDEAQPKERNDEASILSAQKIASNIRPEEITSSVTAYTGAPTVNSRGEVIQGNNRSDALRLMWQGQSEQAQTYKQYLMDHAEEFGLNAEEIGAVEQPVLVNMLDVEDLDAIELGQYVAQDTESGGVERIKPKNTLQRMGNDMQSFSNILLSSPNEEASFLSLVDSNGAKVLKWMNQKGYISPTQYRSAFDSRGNLTAEVKNDIKGIMYQNIFQGNSTRLEEMFNLLPSKAQKAILATAFRDYDSPSGERMIEEIQNSIKAYYALSQGAEFNDAKNYKETRIAVESWKIQYQIDDATGESYLPAENFSNFALLLATMYKGESQSFIQNTFKQMYDLVQGTQEENLFDQPDNTPRTLAEAIYEVLKIEYNGQQRSNVLDSDSTTSQSRGYGGAESPTTGERVEDGGFLANDRDGAESVSGQIELTNNTDKDGEQRTSDIKRANDVQSEANSRGVVADSTREQTRAIDRGDIRVLEEGLGTNGYEHSVDSERDRRTAESERLVKVAKENDLFIPLSKTKDYGKKYPKKTGESVVYRNVEQGKVYKVKNPYAKAALKNGVQPEDVIFEHQIHNLLFPETAYTLEGISQEYGDEVRLVLSQDYVESEDQPSQEQIAEALAKRGLYPEDNYSFGNDLVSVTDVEGDNVLLGDDGELYFIDPIIRFKQPVKAIIEALTAQSLPTIGEAIETAEAETNLNPTEAQKKAGNYKKGHIQVGSFNISIEQPKGSVRSGVDANGKEWQVTMNNTYGYIRGTEGVDGDHIDVFLSSDIDGWNGRRVFVIDQYNPDGSFDEHKVMLGFNEVEEAEYNYLQNYEQGWESSRKIVPTSVLIEDFEKWINSSHRKTKPFAEYKSVKADTTIEQEQPLSLEDMSESITAPELAQSTEEAEPKSKWVADEDADEFAKLRAAMRSKLGQLNSGIDPEVLAIGCKMSYLLMKNGVRKFNSYATAMIEEIGEVIRPMLKSLYEATRYTPEVQESDWVNELSTPDEVYNFNVATFDKSHNDPISTAEMVVAEQEVSKKVEESKTEIKKNRTPKKKKSLSSQQTDSLNLFGSVTNNESADGKQQTTGGENRASDNGVSQGESIGSGATVGSLLDGDLQDGRNERGSDSGVQGEVGEREQSITDRPTGRLPRLNNINNNHSERGVDHAPTSVDARIKANIEAIELSHQLLESGDNATAEQMATLRKFSGWGGLGRAFSNTDYSNRLQQLLGADGYQDAITSANSSYYTPAQVIDTLWDIAEQVGFKGGTILEGSAGVGNIIGQMPIHIGENSDIHAVEIDPTSGGMLSLLYPDANVEIQGFEQTRIQNGSVDLAITNVPFVTGLRVNDTTGDKDLSKKFHNIHDFCIAKNVRKLREGGIGIFISSNGTLDSSKRLRDWVVNEGGSDFIGAFRMNNRTFVGTAVTSDIIVVRKRINAQKSPNAIDVSIVSGERSVEYDTGETRKVKGVETAIIKPLSMDYNKYFIDNPQYMAGDMRFGFENNETFRPTSKGLYPTSGKDQLQMLSDFVKSLSSEEQQERSEKSASTNDTSTDGKKVGELYVKDGSLVVAGVDGSYPLEVNKNKVKGHTKVECFNAYSAIKDTLADVLAYQSENDSDTNLQPLLDALNKAYDSFVKTYGHFNSNTSIAFLRNDVDYPSVFSLETYEEVGDATGKRIKKFGKTDVFSQRVIEKEKEPTPTNVKDGIIASVFKFGRIDIPYISGHLGKSVESVKEEIIKSGYGFEDPVTRQIELSYQYLSGNVREKRRQAEVNNINGEYNANIKALDSVMPMEIPAHLIDFTLGSSWIAPKLYDDYVKDRTNVDVNFSAVGGTWFMKDPAGTYNEKNRSMGVTSAMFHKLIMGHTLIEAAIQNRSINVSQTSKRSDGSTETITDKDATQACAAKIDEIRQDFKDWARVQMQSDSEMSDAMCRIYNDTFNNYVPMNIPDEFVPEYFGGAAHKFRMKPHQGKAIVRGTMQPLLLAHEVGTGKTFTLISTAMEMRRLGTARKPMIVVQNATVGQFVRSAKELYPNAKVLTLEDADRNAQGRKNFYAKIRYNDWDMIVVPQSTFEFIPDSEERQMQFIQERIDEKMTVLEQMQDADPDATSVITRQAEREIETLEAQLAAITSGKSKKRTANQEKKLAITKQNAEIKAIDMLDRRTDDVENFDDMGIDALLIDEAHEYKHLGFATAMQRGVKGVDPSYSKKSQGVFLKTQAVLENNNGRNVIFATGTPISNTAAEIWTFMRYLMPADTMKEYGLYYFDDFVRNFGNIQQMLEFTTSGKYKESNRFAGYVNLPELVRIWSGVSDTVLTKEAEGVNDKIPSIEGEKAQDLYLPQTRALRSIMKYVKSQLQEYENMSGKEKKENSHIPLTMYGIAKAAAVDARLVQSDAEDAEQSKTNEAVRQTLRALKDSAKYKGTVAIFADNYRNRHSGFNLYEDVRSKLIAEGIPADQIVVMKSGMSIKKKLDIFAKVNSGDVRVVLGSTFTLGTGVNIQERLHTLIHLDAPNRPMDYTQRNGRILRQGNLHKDMGIPVRVLRFGVEDSLDVTAYQRLKTKGAIADSIMNGKQMLVNSMTNRVLEEEEDAFGDTIAQLSGSEYAMLKNNAEKNVRKYESRKKQWEADQTYIHNAKPRLKGLINATEMRIAQNSKYLQSVQQAFADGKYENIVVGKNKFSSIDEMTDFFKQYNKSVAEESKRMKEGGDADEQTRELVVNIGDFTFSIKTILSKETTYLGNRSLFSEVHRKMTYSCPELGIEDAPVHQMLLRNAIVDITENVITGNDFAEIIDAAERSIQHNRSELEQLLSREGKPFEHTEELNQAYAQYKEYSELMKVEMEAKEAKYTEMDQSVEAIDDLAELEDEDDVIFRSVYHGSPYSFDKFDHSFMGTGEGAQAFGWGTYVTEVEGVGRHYAEMKNSEGERNLYNVEIPDDNGSNYLMWDDVVDEDVVSKVSDVAMSMDYDTDYMLDSYDSMMDQNNLTGDVFYPMMVSTITDLDGNSITPMVASEILHKAGFIGVSYPAEATSGGRKDNARNYVIFDEADLEITDHTMFRKSINTTKPTNQELANHAQSIVDKLNLNNVEILDNTKGLKGKKRKAKGFYSKSTGKITIVVPNNSSVEDIEQTILHEAVAHYGLRKLFGDHFEEFLDKIFANADEAIRKNIVDLSAKNDWDFRKATEEYLATLAEDTNFENAESEGWWQKIKLFFAEMLRKLDFSGNISDNELRYILWKSYENLKGGQTNDVFSQAADIAMQDRLRVGEYAEDVLDNDVLFRDSTPTEREKDYATAIYEQRVASGWYQTKEAYQDSMLALKEGLLAILKEVGKILHIEEIAGYMNPYLGENRLSGTNMEEANEYRRKFIKPMLAIVAKLAPNDKEYERTVNCLMAKHGLERNEVLAKRDAQKALDKYKVQHPNTKKTIDDFIGNFRKRDYAGLTALTGFDDVEIAEAEAKAMVEDYESSHDSDDIIALWENINKANTEILRKSYMNGMIDKQTFAKIDDMFKFYIPLRGFDEKTSKDVYSYMSEGKGDFKAAIQGAYGRRSKANDPIANMQLMADSSLMQGNRNKLVKLPLLHFARSNKNNLVSISDYWVEYDEVNEDWVVKLPDTIKESDSSEVIKTKTEEFEQRMIELSNEHPEKYKRQKDAINIPYRIDKKNLREHQVVVYQYGKPIILTINGSPRLAQAVNGLTNPDRGAGVVDWALDLMQHGIRWISLACTSLSIDFLGGNLSRDQTWANTSVWAKESPSYAIRFNKNAARVNPVRMKLLFAKHRNGELDMNDPIDFMFNQFVINGGETGYMNLWDLKKTKRETKREIKRAQRGKKGKIDNSITWLGQLGELSRAIENSPRFAAFVTSKEMGRSLERSIWDAKEITVNFNKKGAGATFFGKTGQTTVGNVAAVAAGLGGVLYMFQNAAVQSTTLAGRLFKRNPAKASALFSAWFALGITNVLLSYNGGDDDDEHSYFEQSPYVRRSNMLIRIGDGKWLASPLPHEFRVPYGLGELIATRIIGKDDMTEAELALAIVEQFSQILPIDMVGGGGLRSFIPDLASPLVEAETNRSWTGYPIYYETDYNENDPNWTKAYSNTNQYLVSVAKWLNDVSGGSDYKSGSIDINPAKVEHLLNGYLGGIYGFADKLVKTVETIAGEREPDARNYPIVNRFYKTGNDTTKDRAVKNAYSKAKAEYEETSRLASKYRKNPPKDIFEEAERSVFFESSEYERYDIFRDYKSAIDKLVSYLKGEIPDDDREIYEDRLNELKKEMIGEMNKTRK